MFYPFFQYSNSLDSAFSLAVKCQIGLTYIVIPQLT